MVSRENLHSVGGEPARRLLLATTLKLSLPPAIVGLLTNLDMQYNYIKYHCMFTLMKCKLRKVM